MIKHNIIIIIILIVHTIIDIGILIYLYGGILPSMYILKFQLRVNIYFIIFKLYFIIILFIVSENIYIINGIINDTILLSIIILIRKETVNKHIIFGIYSNNLLIVYTNIL